MNTSHRPRQARVVGYTIMTFASLLLAAGSLVAQSQEPQKPTPEAQQLKERLLQLEQTVEQLKAQINSMEESQKKPDDASGQKVAASASVPATTAEPQSDPKKGES